MIAEMIFKKRVKRSFIMRFRQNISLMLLVLFCNPVSLADERVEQNPLQIIKVATDKMIEELLVNKGSIALTIDNAKH